jgi:hypothetical protein
MGPLDPHRQPAHIISKYDPKVGAMQQGKRIISWTGATQLGIVTIQLVFLLVVLRQFQIESNAFLRIAVLAFGGFVIHHFLPPRLRLTFFSMLSLAGIVIVLGGVTAAWLVGIGGVLIGICHLPVTFRARGILLLSVGCLLAVLRAEWLTVPWSKAVWPILGSMFMFRLIIYMYDLKHDKAPFSLPRTLAYFFMLPNVCFPLFPVVDYKTFRRNYYDTDPYKIYQTGIEWMTRGVIHLILYRYIYYYLTLAPAEVTRPREFVQFAVTTFLLYLRISGQFHLIAGMLHLFGFRLPETHHRYCFSASFTDFWRRINIYWKDFMMKIFYYPMYFRLRKRGTTVAVILSTLFVFFATWLLHSYQWFWLRGSVLLSGPDLTFWSVLAILVVVNSFYELRYGRQRTLTKSPFNIAGFPKKVACTMATFSVICLLWSLWTSETLAEWFALVQSVAHVKLADLASFSVLAFASAIAGAAAGSAPRSEVKSRIGGLFRRGPILNLALLAFLAVIGIQEVYTRFGANAATLINSLRSGRLSRLDVATLEEGYYENLNRVERFNSQLWELYMNRPSNWLDGMAGSGLERFTGDFLQKELVPSFISRTNYSSLRTNRWGMRDKEYEKTPPPNTFRIGMLGASSVMGWGVGDEETFESIVERRLNAERPALYEHYEILNFAVPGYTSLQQVMSLEKALTFNPTTLFYVAAARESFTSVNYLAEVVSKGVDIPYDYLVDLLRRAGVPTKTALPIATRRLFPFRNELLSWSYRTIVARCREHNVVPVLIFLPQVEKGGWQEETPDILRIGKEAGFIVWDLSDVYNSRDVTSIRLAEWDDHPNAIGHQLVASVLYSLMTGNSLQIRLSSHQ